MRLILKFCCAALLTGSPFAGWSQSAEQRAIWNRPAEPFRIFDNVYYVGTAGLSSFLIADRAGHILIDGALPESAPLIAANIRRLGFNLRDVRYLLINHSHVDHSGGLAELKRLTGAKLVASAGDKADLEMGRTVGRSDLAAFPAVKVDRVIGEGGQVRLGASRLTAILTPGHTKGATSWVMTAGGKRVIFVSSISVAGQGLVADPSYPRAAADFEATFRKLRTSKADIFLSYHAEGFDLEAKRAKLAAGDAGAFVDPSELGRAAARAEQAFRTQLAQQKARAREQQR